MSVQPCDRSTSRHPRVSVRTRSPIVRPGPALALLPRSPGPPVDRATVATRARDGYLVSDGSGSRPMTPAGHRARVGPTSTLPFVEAAGEAAFYGPNLDCSSVRSRSRGTIATSSVLNQPSGSTDLPDGGRHGRRAVGPPCALARWSVSSPRARALQVRCPLVGALPLFVCMGPEQDGAPVGSCDARSEGLRSVIEHDGALRSRCGGSGIARLGCCLGPRGAAGAVRSRTSPPLSVVGRAGRRSRGPVALARGRAKSDRLPPR